MFRLVLPGGLAGVGEVCEWRDEVERRIRECLDIDEIAARLRTETRDLALYGSATREMRAREKEV
jgi:uncharacterized membrane protein YebE (DUF533 family)